MGSHSSGIAWTWSPAFASTGSVYDILHLIWKTYHYSLKSMRKLQSIGTELGINVLKPTQVSGTGWLPHISRTLQVLITSSKDGSGQYAAVLCHMEHLRSTSKNAVACTLRSKMVAFACLMHKLWLKLGIFSLYGKVYPSLTSITTTRHIWCTNCGSN